ncbi:metallophosphoesterase family protein [Sphingobacterium litopenaei]|uniref:Nuclease SbcCD subunit D n=1 Tax=Sphingobacterium litopenaei TaxID=2763500 RepID=A0ABR7YG93_9SPHI|nr:exonuclease subunit SbcD [Sphingobacterium litopenaei]MBD1430243.1 exonuclease subunit SbcD [Sphingobacterium litopenaei]
MKILHTADWHLGKKLDYISRLDEQKEVLQEICEIAEQQKVDLVIVAGDLFDTFNPPVDATELLYQTLKRLTANGTRPVLAIAGNHDSPDRIDSPDPLARACGIIFIGYPHAEVKPFELDNSFAIINSDKGFLEIKLKHIPYPVRILTTAYANELRLKQFLGIENKGEQLNEVLRNSWQNLADQYCNANGVNLLTAHLYMLQRGGEILEEPEGEKPIKIGNADIVYSDAIPTQIQYTALGHLHRYQFIKGHQNPVVYCSSPLAYSFSEAGQEKKVVIVDVEPNQEARIQALPLRSGKQLCRKTFYQVDEAVAWLHENPYTLVELTMVSDTFMTSADLKRIHEAHDGIIHIIPIVNKADSPTEATEQVKLNQDIHSLFGDYFKSKYGQEPNEELKELFREVFTHSKQGEE